MRQQSIYSFAYPEINKHIPWMYANGLLSYN